MLSTLDTIIAFAVIMTVLSLLITIIVQMVSAGLALRGKNLANALALTFQTIDPNIGEQAHSLAAQILRDPIFSDSLWRRKSRATLSPAAQLLIAAEKKLKEAHILKGDHATRDRAVKAAQAAFDAAKAAVNIPKVKPNREKPWHFWSWPWGGATQLGSAIRPGEIYRVLHDLKEMGPEEASLLDIPSGLIGKASSLLSALQQIDRPAIESQDKLKAIAEAADLFTTTGQKEAVLNALSNFGATVERATTQAYDRFQRWFGSAQDRAEQWFQMHVRMVTIVFALLVAFLLQLDTIEMFRQLRARPRTVEALTQAASGVIEEGRNVLDPANTPAHETYLLWSQKYPNFALEKIPAAGTDAAYREAIDARLQNEVGSAALNQQEVARLLADYDAMKEKGTEEFLNKGRERVQRLQETLANADFPLAPTSFLGRWDDPNHGRAFWLRVGQFWPHLFGVLLTAGLLSLGAPFWFNLLKNLMSLRPAIASLIEKRPTSAPALPPAPSVPPSPS